MTVVKIDNDAFDANNRLTTPIWALHHWTSKKQKRSSCIIQALRQQESRSAHVRLLAFSVSVFQHFGCGPRRDRIFRPFTRWVKELVWSTKQLSQLGAIHKYKLSAHVQSRRHRILA